MIIYSIVPPEIIFEEKANEFNASNLIEINYLGEKLQVTPLENNRYMIQRILSTSLKSYLNPDIQPGKVINMGQ